MILVVGGAGYIGSHMLKLLRETGEPHLAFDNFEQGHRAALMGSPHMEGDLRKIEDPRQCLREHPEIDVVMHFAASISVGESVRYPAKYWRNNVLGVVNLLEAMAEMGVSKFVFSSTAAIFGEPERVPIDESHPTAPTSPYGETKLAAERLIADFEAAHTVQSVCLRYFNAAGADPSGEIGEDHAPEEHLIPLAMLAALGKRPPLTVFGTDYDTPDGTCVRDYIHVNDLASAHLLAVGHLRSGGESRSYNLGNGNGYSVREVLAEVERVIGQPVPSSDGDRRPGDPARLIASSAAIQKDWGWKPQFPELRTIVEHAWKWHSGNPNGYAGTKSGLIG